jgi:hypothetical protein
MTARSKWRGANEATVLRSGEHGRKRREQAPQNPELAGPRRAPASGAGSIFDLHRLVGNRAFKELVNPNAPQKKCACGGTCSHCRHEGHGSEHAQETLVVRRHLHKAMNLPEDATEPGRSQKKIAGLDVDKSLCGCAKDIPEKIKWSQLQAKLYLACSKDPKNKTGQDVDDCNEAELAKMGITTTVAGTTSSTGVVKVKPVAGSCGPLWQKATEIHEGEHHGHQAALEKAYGKGTPAYAAHWDDPKDWGEDEARAYTAEIPFYQAVLAYLQSICGGGGSSGLGALLGGLGGAGVGALIGGLAFGPLGALAGLAIGGLVGAVAGGLIGGAI